jgi:hypothetical protein
MFCPRCAAGLVQGDDEKIGRQHRQSSLHRLESTVRYLGIEVDDALEMAEHTEV